MARCKPRFLLTGLVTCGSQLAALALPCTCLALCRPYFVCPTGCLCMVLSVLCRKYKKPRVERVVLRFDSFCGPGARTAKSLPFTGGFSKYRISGCGGMQPSLLATALFSSRHAAADGNIAPWRSISHSSVGDRPNPDATFSSLLRVSIVGNSTLPGLSRAPWERTDQLPAGKGSVPSLRIAR